MEQQQTFYKNEVVKGIDYKPTKKQGSFQWRVFAESGNMYSFFAPTFEQDQTPLNGIFATNMVKIGYTTRFFQGKTYFNLMSIDREMSSADASPAMDAAITQQEQMTMPPQGTLPAPQATTIPMEQTSTLPAQSEPDFVRNPTTTIPMEQTSTLPAQSEPDFIRNPTSPMENPTEPPQDGLGGPETAHKTMMADPVARATIAAAIINVYQANGLLGKGADTIMKKVYGIIEAMDSLGE